MDNWNDHPHGDDVVAFPDLAVGEDGRVRLKPRGRARRGGLEVGVEATAYVITPDGDEFFIPGDEIGTEFRITIPEHQREKYGLEPGDDVDVYVEPSGDQ